ncbi:hypothetical protein D3C87_1895770 [compost metagenome]
MAPKMPDGMTQSSAEADSQARPQGSASTTNRGSVGKRESPFRLRLISAEIAPLPVQPSTNTMFSAPWAWMIASSATVSIPRSRTMLIP